MIALKNPNNKLDVFTTIAQKGHASEQYEQEHLDSAVETQSPVIRELGRMEMTPSRRAVLWSVKVYLVLMVGLFGYHFLTLIH